MENALANLSSQLFSFMPAAQIKPQGGAIASQGIDFRGLFSEKIKSPGTEEVADRGATALFSQTAITPELSQLLFQVHEVTPGGATRAAESAVQSGISLPQVGQFMPQLSPQARLIPISLNAGSAATQPELPADSAVRLAQSAPVLPLAMQLTALRNRASADSQIAPMSASENAHDELTDQLPTIKSQAITVKQAYGYNVELLRPQTESKLTMQLDANPASSENKQLQAELSSLQGAITEMSFAGQGKTMTIPVADTNLVTNISPSLGHFIPAATATTVSTDTAAVTQSMAQLDLTQVGYEEPLARQMIIMANRGQQQARLMLNPPELGNVDVKLEVRDNEVKLNLITHTLAAKESLDAAMPRLRELLSDSGMNLLDTQVSQRDASQTDQFQDKQLTEHRKQLDEAQPPLLEEAGPGLFMASVDLNSLIDIYA